VEIEGYNRDGWQNTQEAIASGAKILFQPTAIADPLLCRADILEKKGNGWTLNEVKSATTVKKEYPYDIAFQHMCFENAGIKIDRINLVHINNKYIRQGDIELDKLFVSEDITEAAMEKMEEAKQIIRLAIQTVKRNEPPDDKMLSLCSNPRTCEYLKIWYEYIGKSIALPEIEETTNAKGIEEKLSELQYPLYFLDYETWSAAIPPFDSTRPYQNIPFQYSLGIKSSPDTEVKYTEFLSRKFENPVPALLAQLKKEIGPKGSVLAWNSSFERGCNDEMARMEPCYADFLKGVNERMFDPMMIFKLKNQLYTRNAFGGSASLKAVLPVLCPELAYDDLVERVRKLKVQD